MTSDQVPPQAEKIRVNDPTAGLTAAELTAIGGVAIAWAMLDFVLRATLKRLEGEAWSSQRSDKIWAIKGHGELVRNLQLKIDCVESDELKSRLKGLVSAISSGRTEGLYGKRNELLHSMVFKTDEGKALLRRVGAVTPPVVVDDLIAHAHDVAAKIAAIAKEIASLTAPDGDPFDPVTTVVEVSAYPGPKAPTP